MSAALTQRWEMVGERDWELLLQRSREDALHDEIHPLLPEICTDETLEDETRLRLLGNVVAGDDLSRQALQTSGLVEKLLDKGGKLPLSVLLNATSASPEFAKWLISEPGFVDAVANYSDGTEGVDLVLEIKELLGGIPMEIGISLLSAGFIQLILIDTHYEECEYVREHFGEIYRNATSENPLPNHLGPPETTGIRIIGAITSCKQFDLRTARQIIGMPFTWELVTVLANLTAKLIDVPPVLDIWPHAVEEVLERMETENFSYLSIHVGLPYLRNVARNDRAAKQMVPYHMEEVLKISASAPLMEDTAWHLVAHYLSNVHDHVLLMVATGLEPGPRAQFVAAKAIHGLLKTPNHRDIVVTKDAQLLAVTIESCLLVELADASAWIHGAVSLLKLAEVWPVHIHWTELQQKAPQNSELEILIDKGCKLGEIERISTGRSY